MFTNTFLREMRAIVLSKEQIMPGWLPSGQLERKMERLNIHIIEDHAFEKLDTMSRFNAGPAFIRQLRSQGFDTAGEWLSNHYRAINRRSSVDLKAIFA